MNHRNLGRFCLLLGAGIILYVLSWFYVVWPPDVITGWEVTVTETTSLDGHYFAVTQHWNYVDFYSTYFVHQPPSGDSIHILLGGDDLKRWWTALKLNPQNFTVAI